MKLRTLLAVISIITLLYQPVRAQEYGTAVGVRLGSLTAGFNVKSFLNTSGAIEGIVGIGHHSVTITGLYEKHHPIHSADGLNWYVGAGAHVGFFDHHGTYLRYKHKDEKYYVYHDEDNAVVPGVDVIIGLEWKIPLAPLTVGIDLKPQIDFYHGAHSYFDAAFNLRYIL